MHISFLEAQSTALGKAVCWIRFLDGVYPTSSGRSCVQRRSALLTTLWSCQSLSWRRGNL